MAGVSSVLPLCLMLSAITVTGMQSQMHVAATGSSDQRPIGHGAALRHQTNYAAGSRRSRNLQGITPLDYDGLMATAVQFIRQISDLVAIDDATQLRQVVGSDVTAFTQTKLSEADAVFQDIEQFTTDASAATNYTLTAEVVYLTTDVISAIEKLGGVLLRVMTSTRLSSSSGGLDLLVAKERHEEFRGFILEAPVSAKYPVYISVPQDAARADMAGVVAFSVQGASRMLYGGARDAVVATPVVVCSMMDATGRPLKVNTLDPAVTFSLGHGGVRPDPALHQVAVCSYMTTTGNGSFSGWSSSSCTVVRDTDTGVTCQCTHLTTFTVIYKPEDTTLSINMITWASCAFTALCALIVVMTMIGYGLLDTDRSYVRINFLVAVGLSEAVFLSGTRYTDVPAVCYIVAGTLHWCCLACFTWLLSYIFLLGTEMRMTNVNRRVMTSAMYTVMGWGVPMCIVSVTIIWRYTSYRDQYYCWISSSRYMVQLSFFIPIAIVFVISWIILFYVMNLYRKLRSDPARVTLVAVTWSGIRSCTILSPLLAGTWVLAAFVVTMRTLWLQATFTVCNVLLGFTIFFSMCFLNEEIRQARRQRKVVDIRKSTRPDIVNNTIEAETIIDACESGKCIHASKCFYGQVGFQHGRQAETLETKDRCTPIAEEEVPRESLVSSNRPTPKLGGLVDLAKLTSSVQEKKRPERPPRTESMAHLLPGSPDPVVDDGDEVEIHRTTASSEHVD